MNIGIIVDNELNNDIRVLREIKILKAQGLNIFVLCLGFRKEYKVPVDGISITRISIPRKIKDGLFFFQNMFPIYEWLWSLLIKKHILRNDLNILHVHDLYMSRTAHKAILQSGRKIPMVLDLHENYPFQVTTYNWTKGLLRKFLSKPGAWKKKEHEYLSYAMKIIVLSGEFRDVLTSKYPDLKKDLFVVLPNVPDIESQPAKREKVEKPFNNDFPVMFYYGVIAERRGIFDALEVFINLVKEGHHINFLLIGPVDKTDKPLFVQITNQELLSGRVHYIPWIDSDRFPSYLEICDICVAPFHKNPQHESGVANKIYEYMLGGKPVIASDCQPQQHLIETYDCGLIFRNSTEFHDAIITMASNKELRITLGGNGQKAILNTLNSSIVKNNLISVYFPLAKE